MRNLGATTLSIVHDMVTARKIANIIAMIHEDNILWQGPALDVSHSGNELVE